MKKLHKWNKDDTIVNFYYAKYGVMGIPVRDEVELAHDIIGCSVASLIMQTSNIRYRMGFENNLPDYSKLQNEVCQDFRGVERPIIRDMVVAIIKQRKADNRVRRMKSDGDYKTVRRVFRRSIKELDNTFKHVAESLLG